MFWVLIFILMGSPYLVMGQCDPGNNRFPFPDTSCILSEFSKSRELQNATLNDLGLKIDTMKQQIQSENGELQNATLNELERKVNQLAEKQSAALDLLGLRIDNMTEQIQSELERKVNQLAEKQSAALDLLGLKIDNMKQQIQSELKVSVDLQTTALGVLETKVNRLAEKQTAALDLLGLKIDNMKQQIQSEITDDLTEIKDKLINIEKAIPRPIPILIRRDGSVNFHRPWADYKAGFGSLGTEYWIGLDELHTLTHTGHYGLRVNMTAWNGTSLSAYYRHFSVGSASGNYVLSVGGYDSSSTAGDSLVNVVGYIYGDHDGMQFSTYDRDNDKHTGANCASSQYRRGGWWYKACGAANPTGEYVTGGRSAEKGVFWYSAFRSRYSFKTFTLTLAPK